MKIFLTAVAAVVIVCITGLLIGQTFKALFTGESYRMPVPKNITVVVPYSPR
jgi:hypothetical protein